MQLIINVEGRMDWITLDSVIFAPVILYLENWINIEMDQTEDSGGRQRTDTIYTEGNNLSCIFK